MSTHTGGSNSDNSLDSALDTLSDSHRRHILLALTEQSLRPVDELHFNASLDDDKDLTTHKLNLHHTHLPKLAEHGYLETNPQSDVVRRGPQFNAIESLLETLRNNQHHLAYDFPRHPVYQSGLKRLHPENTSIQHQRHM
ncbi:DUF7344 domain-containing protein [Haloprofundus marisrubri]|uniref:DUF7344 domain-containing protein n=1 Tax=Haloprofundus marisrubri TaxID=1514971 RepID=UPI00138F3C49|nr:hypothetical protein [Haloprofundus marisrubri]